MENLSTRAIKQMKDNRNNMLNGIYNCIPHKMPRFSKFWPGIEKSKIYLVTANSGIGKSKFSKKVFVFDTIEYAILNPDKINLKIFYFCLEESKINFMQSFMSYKLALEEEIRASTRELRSVDTILDESIIDKLESLDYWNKFEEIVDVLDEIRHPYGIFKYVQDWLEENGSWSYKDKEFDGVMTKIKDYYTSNKPEQYTIIIVDHISLITTEKGSTLHQSITKLSSTYFIELRDKYQCTIVNVQQQSASSEEKQFTFKGQSIESKLEPSLQGLGDSKLTQRDADIVFGLFSPDRYEIEDHRGYNIVKLQDHYRSLIILKYRDGIPNIKLGMFFDGSTGIFEELKLARNITDQDYYDYMKRVGLIEPSNQINLNFENND